MEFLQAWFDNTNIPLLSAFILGLMTAISPCPLATNITAIAYIGKDIQSKPKVFFNGLIYTLGRAISYTALGLILYFAASQFQISRFIQQWGEKILGPLLLIVGILMLDLIKIKFPEFVKFSKKMEDKSRAGFWGTLFLGMVFALAFCPYSGVLYFGMLIPMTISSPSGLYLPILFALGTGLPVIIFSWIIAFTVGGIGQVYNKIKIFEKWFRKIVAVIFVAAGLYFIITYFL